LHARFTKEPIRHDDECGRAARPGPVDNPDLPGLGDQEVVGTQVAVEQRAASQFAMFGRVFKDRVGGLGERARGQGGVKLADRGDDRLQIR
jgi:hypothetical protein